MHQPMFGLLQSNLIGIKCIVYGVFLKATFTSLGRPTLYEGQGWAPLAAQGLQC